MKNMKVSRKLLSGFLIVIILAAAIGVVGIFGLNSMSNAAEHMYSDMGIPLGDLGLASEYFQRIRVQLRNTIIYTGDADHLQTVEADLTDRMGNFETDMIAYESTIVTEGGKNLFTETMDEYESVMKSGVTTILDHAKSGMPQAQLMEEMGAITIAADNIANNLRELTQLRLTVMSDANDGTTETFNTLFIVVIAAIGATVVASLILAFYISGLISKPLTLLAAFMKKAGATGDIALQEQDRQVIGTYGKRKDEIGETIAASASFVTRITEISKALETVSNGDLTVEIAPLTDMDTLGLSLQKMSGSLNMMFSEINTATTQVSAGASQVSDGAQALASGATEQAASIEEISSSITEIADKIKENAGMAEQAAQLGDTIKVDAEKGTRQMEAMMTAVKEINDASRSISQIIKTIDDIAFQTNILALNAAVEAARAGIHGKGFAVVAEEVRNLAAKSAEAAKSTDAMIQDSMEKSTRGSSIAGETAASLAQIVSGINESSQLVTEISRSSEEQAAGISQINVGVDQVAQVVQQNSATAQQSAAAPEEMSSQSALLQELVAQFKVKGGENNRGVSALPGVGKNRVSAADGLPSDGSHSDHDKY